MAPAAFWRAWSIWAVSVAATATTVSYTALHPLPAELASQFGSGLNGSLGVVFVVGFATVGALLAWKRPGNPIGWLLSAIGLAYAVGVCNVFLAHFPRTLTLAYWLGWIFLLGIGLWVFVARLKDAVDLDAVRDDLATVVTKALEPAHVSVWMSQRR